MTPLLRALGEAELFDWLRLTRSDNVGPRTFRILLDRHGSTAAAIAALPRLAKAGGARAVRLAAADDITREMDEASRRGLVFLPLCDPRYPASLRAADSAPPVIAVQGRLDVLGRSSVAIVGSRNASAGALVFTERLARELGDAGLTIVSGLARGIDARAHAASLATGTVAVLAGGHAHIYPHEHLGLAARIAEEGAVVSEMPIGWEPRGRDFPRRNRIVSGLSLAVVVVEAAQRSGSLITARFAGEQGRELFAVPGSPLDPRSEGTNALLKQGATMCTGSADVLAEVRPMEERAMTERLPVLAVREASAPLYWDEAEGGEGGDAPGPAPARAALSPTLADDAEDEEEVSRFGDPAARVLALLGAAPVAIDELVRLAGLPAGALQGLLTMLDMDGHIVRHGATAVSRRLTD